MGTREDWSVHGWSQVVLGAVGKSDLKEEGVGGSHKHFTLVILLIIEYSLTLLIFLSFSCIHNLLNLSLLRSRLPLLSNS